MRPNLIKSLFALIFSFLVNASVGNPTLETNKGIKLLEKSKEMLSFMDETANPCEDFDQFTCGKWRELYPAEADPLSQTNYLKLIITAYQKKVIEMLKDNNDPKDDEIDKMIKNFYHSCISLENGVHPESIFKVINEFGEMPALTENWNDEKFDWLDLLSRIKHKYGFQIMIGIEVMNDLKDNSANRVHFGDPEFHLESKEIYLEEVGASYRKTYEDNIVTQLNGKLGVEEEKAKETAKKIVEFEAELAKGMEKKGSSKTLDSLLVKTSAEEMQQKYGPTIDVKRFLNIVFGEIPDGIIYELGHDYMRNLKEVIERTEKRIIADYIFYQLLRRFDLDDSETPEELENNCLTFVNEHFYKKVLNMFYKRYRNKEAEDDIRDIWNQLKSVFSEKLRSDETLDWITPETRENAIKKLDALKLEVLSHEDYDFEKDFGNVITNANDYVGNLQNVIEASAKIHLRKLHEPPSKPDSSDLAIIPANNLNKNAVLLPPSVLQPYFLWGSEYPKALKFGSVGFLLAHELLHGFDDVGRQYGKSGNLEEWWDSESLKHFTERRTCFTKQYHSYINGKRPLPESENQSENIADNGGLKLAYDAYMKAKLNSIDEASNVMPNFKYTDEQLFFISFGQVWCSDVSDELKDYQAAADEHTPERFRTIGTVSNLVEFSKAFNCAADDEMNPDTKCKLY